MKKFEELRNLDKQLLDALVTRKWDQGHGPANEWDLEVPLALINKYYDHLSPQWEVFLDLQDLYFKWVIETPSTSFRKNKKLSVSFQELSALDEEVSTRAQVFGCRIPNLAGQKLLTSLLINLESFQMRSIAEKRLFLKANDEFSCGFEFGSSYSRDSFWKSILSDLEQWLLIFFTATETRVSVNDISYAMGHFMLFLEDEKFLLTNAKNVKERTGSMKKSTKYARAVNYTMRNLHRGPRADFPNVLPEFSINEPILLVNEFYTSGSYYKGMGLLVGDWIFNPIATYQPNSAYGYITRKPTLTSRGVEVIEGRGTAKIDLTQEGIEAYKTVLLKEKSTALYIDKEGLEKKTIDFVNDKLKETNLSIESSCETIEGVLGLYTTAESSVTLKVVSNVYTLAHLKLFIAYTSKSEKVYFHFKRDGRMRKYFTSLVSPTNFKYSRFYLNYGRYSLEELREVVMTALASRSMEVVLSQGFHLTSKFHESFYSSGELGHDLEAGLSSYKRAVGLSFLINIGQAYKSSLLKKSPSGFSLTMEDFVRRGEEEFKKFLSNEGAYRDQLSSEEREVSYKLLFYLEGLKYGLDWFAKVPTGFDFSCSGHQLRYLHRTLEDSSGYDYLNLRGTSTFTDMYSLIIVTFKNKLKDSMVLSKTLPTHDGKLAKEGFRKLRSYENIAHLLELMDRKTLKKSIMTKEYNTTYLTFKNYFVKAVATSGHYEFYKNHKEEYGVLLKVLYEFVNDLDGKLPNFKTGDGSDSRLPKIARILTNAAECGDYRITTWDGCELGFAVFTKVATSERIYYNSKTNRLGGKSLRITAQLNFYSSSVDDAGTQRSFLPNFIHHLDANVVRMVIYYSKRDYAYISIHDEYFVPFQEVFEFKDLANDVIKLDPLRSPLEGSKRSVKNHPLVLENIRDFYNYFVI